MNSTLVEFLDGQHFFDANEGGAAWAAHNSQVGSDTDFIVLVLVFQDFHEGLLHLHVAWVVSEGLNGGQTDGDGQNSRSDAFRDAVLYFR